MQNAQIVAMKEYLVTKQMGVSITAQLLDTWLSFHVQKLVSGWWFRKLYGGQFFSKLQVSHYAGHSNSEVYLWKYLLYSPLFMDYCTLSFVFSFRNGRITVRAASTYQGWLMKWIPLKRAGKQSWRPSIISFRTRGLRLEDCLNENSLQSTTTTKPFTWLRGFSISLSRVSNKAR